MQNEKFRCVLALFAADEKKKKTILSSTMFNMAKYMVPLE